VVRLLCGLQILTLLTLSSASPPPLVSLRCFRLLMRVLQGDIVPIVLGDGCIIVGMTCSEFHRDCLWSIGRVLSTYEQASKLILEIITSFLTCPAPER
jgi:hypothetical protein